MLNHCTGFFLLLSLLFSSTTHAMNAAQLATQRWYIVNDTVMGGLSRANLAYVQESDVIRFTGSLSLDNNGGFASVRMLANPRQYKSAYAICIRVMGDGREYQLRLRRANRGDGVAYRQTFATVAGEWHEYTLPIADFIPTFRGRTLSDYGPISAADIGQIGFMLADKQPGSFQLDIASVKGCLQQA